MSSRKILSVRETPGIPVLTLAVHGFSYDPNSGESENNPHNNFFPHIKKMLPENDVTGVAYYSVPAGIKGVCKAWLNGRWNRYRYAWDLARKESQTIVEWIQAANRVDEPLNIVCHSLGSKVVFDALDTAMDFNRSNPVNKVIIFNGADHREHVEDVVLRHRKLRTTQFLNVFTRTDKVISALGGHFAPVESDDGKYYRHLLGRAGSAHKECIGKEGSPMLHRHEAYLWADLDCTFPRFPVKATGPLNCMVEGDQDNNIGDHSWTLKREENWKVFRPFLEDKYDIIPAQIRG